MNHHQDIFKKNYVFFLGLFLYCFISLGLMQFYGRDSLHLLINRNYTDFLDVFFKYFSKFGPVVFILSILFVVIKKEKYRTLFILLSSYLLNFIIVTIVKKTFFIHVHRPTYYFEQKGVDLHLIEGVTSQIPFTFPSGHTSEAFLLMLFVCLLFHQKWMKYISVFIAVLMAFSRVYLSKHFLVDTVGGAILGVFILMSMYYLFQNKKAKVLSRKIIKLR